MLSASRSILLPRMKNCLNHIAKVSAMLCLATNPSMSRQCFFEHLDPLRYRTLDTIPTGDNLLFRSSAGKPSGLNNIHTKLIYIRKSYTCSRMTHGCTFQSSVDIYPLKKLSSKNSPGPRSRHKRALSSPTFSFSLSYNQQRPEYESK